MEENLFKSKVTCPQCNAEFEINTRIFGVDDDLTCFNCGSIFSINGCILDLLKVNIEEITKEIKRRIREAEKGNIKISSTMLKKMRDTLAEYNL